MRFESNKGVSMYFAFALFDLRLFLYLFLLSQNVSLLDHLIRVICNNAKILFTVVAVYG